MNHVTFCLYALYVPKVRFRCIKACSGLNYLLLLYKSIVQLCIQEYQCKPPKLWHQLLCHIVWNFNLLQVDNIWLSLKKRQLLNTFHMFYDKTHIKSDANVARSAAQMRCITIFLLQTVDSILVHAKNSRYGEASKTQIPSKTKYKRRENMRNDLRRK